MQSPKKARSSIGSPKKARPSTAISPKKASVIYNSNISQIQIIEELNGQAIATQDKDIEIERLQTTCYSLNNKASVTDDLHQEVEVLKRRLRESEDARENLKKEVAEYERNRLQYEKNRVQTLQQHEAVIADYERLRIQ